MDSTVLEVSSCSLAPNQTFSPTRNNRDVQVSRCSMRHRSSRQRRVQTNSSIVISSSRMAQIERQLTLKDEAARKISRYLRSLQTKKKAAIRIRRFIYKHLSNFRRNTSLKKYLQYGRWTRTQADRVFAMVLRWRSRRLLQSSPLVDLSSQYLEMLRALLDMIGYHGPALRHGGALIERETRFASFIRGDFKNAHVNFLDHADRSVFVSITRELLLCKEALRAFLTDHRRWVPFPGYWDYDFFPLAKRRQTIHRNRSEGGVPTFRIGHSKLRPISQDSFRSSSAPQFKSIRRRPPSKRNEQRSKEIEKKNLSRHPIKLVADRARSVQSNRQSPERDDSTKEVLAEQRRQSAMANRRVRIDDLTTRIEKAMDELKTTTDSMKVKPKRNSIINGPISGGTPPHSRQSVPNSPLRQSFNPGSQTESKQLTPQTCSSPVRMLRSPTKSSPLAKKWDGKFPGHFDFGFSLWFKGKRKTHLSDELSKEIARGPSEAFSQIKFHLMRSSSLLEDKPTI